MDDILKTIDKALKNKGLSDAAASRLAAGNPALIKNMRAARDGEKRYSVQSLRKLAEVLELEFVFGPNDAVPPPKTTGLAEQDAGSDHEKREALRAGFLPIPFHNASGPDHRGAAPVALSRSWLAGRKLKVEALNFLPVQNDDMAPALNKGALALIDTEDRSTEGAGIWSAAERGSVLFCRLERPARNLIVISQDNVSRPVRVLRDAELATFRILGKVIWIAGA